MCKHELDDLIETADELDKTSLAIGASGSAATLVTGVGGTPAAFVGAGFVVGKTIYSFNAELEKDKLREEYKLWENGEKMSKLGILGYFFVFISISLSIGLYKIEIRKCSFDEKYEYMKKHRIFGSLTKYLSIISIISLVVLNLKFLIDKDYKFIVDYGSIWLIFFFFTILTGFCQKRDSIYFKEGLIAAVSALWGIIVFAYAFRKVLF